MDKPGLFEVAGELADGGKRCPGTSAPVAISVASWARTCSKAGTGDAVSTVMRTLTVRGLTL
jgi:hypothetical protein